VNGVINIPNGTVSKTDANTWTINSTGGSWANTNVAVGTLALGAANVLPATTNLLLGQNDTNTAVLNLNGFNQTVASLTSNPTTVGTNTTGKSLTSATPATLTVNQATDTTYASLITGSTSLVKDGVGSLTLSGASTFTGNVTVNSGTLVAGGATVTSLGSATTAGRTVTVNNGSTLSFTTNNVFGNGVNNNNLPSVTLNGSTLTSTRYNVLGNLALNGATLTQAATDSGNYEGYQFRGTVTVGGTAASTIATTNGKADHLGPNTTFDVGDVTGSAAGDLVVSAPLRDQSGDFGNAAGALTKIGAGTMELAGANFYTGGTTVNAGTLLVSGSITGLTTVNSGGTLGGTGIVGPVSVIGGTVAPGTGPGTLSTSDFSLNSTAVVKFELAQPGTAGGGTNDLISVAGGLTLDGTLQLTELAGFGTGTYRLFDYTGTLVNNTLDLQSAFLAAHPGSRIDTSSVGQVNLVVVPEPTAIVSLLGGVGMLAGLQRFRRRNRA
jgi:autotransporter-associated beta strand protein